MFNNVLPANINVYATSASSPDESSWGCYCPPQDMVNGKRIGSCLGDLYSVNWLEDSDKGLAKTLQQQFLTVQKLTTQSKVMQWGDLTWTNQSIADFQGEKKMLEAEPVVEYTHAEPAHYSPDELRSMSAVSTYDIPMHLSYYQYLRHDARDMQENHDLLGELIAELTMRQNTDRVMLSLTNKLAGERATAVMNDRTGAAVVQGSCLDIAKRVYVAHCGEFTDYARKYVRVLNNLCNFPGVSIAHIEGGLQALCPIGKQL